MIPVAPVCRGGTMRANELVVELGVKLGIPLRLSEAGTCRVTFDDDDVDFEQSGDALYIMAEIASAAGREDSPQNPLSSQKQPLSRLFSAILRPIPYLPPSADK